MPPIQYKKTALKRILEHVANATGAFSLPKICRIQIWRVGNNEFIDIRHRPIGAKRYAIWSNPPDGELVKAFFNTFSNSISQNGLTLSLVLKWNQLK